MVDVMLFLKIYTMENACPHAKIKITQEVSQKLQKIKIKLAKANIIADSIILVYGTNSKKI
jgi:nitrite reductase/ring-hydroxylating ferredoxin subunit